MKIKSQINIIVCFSFKGTKIKKFLKKYIYIMYENKKSFFYLKKEEGNSLRN